MAGTMHSSVRDRLAYATVKDEPWEGDVQAPSGAFFGTELHYTVLAIWEEFGDGQPDHAPLQYAVLREDSVGLLHVEWFNTHDEAEARLIDLREDLDRWLMATEED